MSILTAVVWAFAVILFKKSGESVHPLALNAFKNLLTIALLVPTVWLLGQTLLPKTPEHVYIILLLSGAVGIGIGDTLFFKSLNVLGAGLTGIVVCFYSPCIIIFSFIWLHESLNLIQLLGVLLIISAVLISTVRPRNGTKFTTAKIISGIVYGIIASAAMAVGVVLMKPLLSTYPVFWVALIRLVGGTAILAIVLLVHPGRGRIVDTLFKTRSWGYTILGAFFGTYLSMTIWIAGMKYTQASIASALNQTSTIFIFIFAGLLLKEPMTLRRTVAILIAFIGAFLVSFF